MKRVKVVTDKGSKVVEAELRGDWCYHEKVGNKTGKTVYSVTHVPSGLKVIDVGKRSVASKLVRALSDVDQRWVGIGTPSKSFQAAVQSILRQVEIGNG